MRAVESKWQVSEEIPRVWVNVSDVNQSFIDYTYIHRGGPCATRLVIPPGVGIRLPKSTTSVDKTGPDMREGRSA